MPNLNWPRLKHRPPAKIDDKAAWASRLASGKDALIKSVTIGKGAMPAKGGATLSDAEIKSVVEYVMGKAK